MTGNLAGFLSSEFGQLSANALRGLMTVTGAASASLNVQDLQVSASVPIEDETTFWRIEALDMDDTFLCAWSGGGPCPDF